MTKWRKMTMMMREMRKSRMMVTLAKRVTRGMMMMRKMKVKGGIERESGGHGTLQFAQLLRAETPHTHTPPPGPPAPV